MKTEYREIKDIEVVYIANDGKEFNNEKECYLYEMWNNKIGKKAFEKFYNKAKLLDLNSKELINLRHQIIIGGLDDRDYENNLGIDSRIVHIFFNKWCQKLKRDLMNKYPSYRYDTFYNNLEKYCTDDNLLTYFYNNIESLTEWLYED